MNAILNDLTRSQRLFFTFLVRRGLLGTLISFFAAAAFLLADIGGIASLMMRASGSWLWIAFFCFDIWVTVTGITIAVGLWKLGDWRDPPAD